MLVFISDLHFVDGSAGEHNLSPRAFEYFFDDLVAIATKPSNEIKEIKIVLLGDIFDLLRTTTGSAIPSTRDPGALMSMLLRSTPSPSLMPSHSANR